MSGHSTSPKGIGGGPRPAVARLLLTLLALLLAACGQSGTSTQGNQEAAPTTAPAATTEATGAPAATAAPAAAAIPTPGPNEFRNPVLRADFADPFLLRVGDTYYAYATNASGKNVQVASSTDLVQWKQLPDAMPALGKWAKLGGSFVWAPEVIQIGEQYLLYYTARDKAADKQCIGVAVADKPEGRFRDPNDTAFVCQAAQGGSIDASPFRDEDGTLYLYWKNDGNCCGQSTYIYVQELAPDGLSLVGEPVTLVQNDRRWEGPLIEAPTMWKQDGSYYLFFSANAYAGVDYAVGYATCETATGPCQDAEENPILASVLDVKPPVIGPGHQTVLADENGETWLVYHAWEVTGSGQGTRRFMWIDRLAWEDGKPVLQGPTLNPQPRPDAQ